MNQLKTTTLHNIKEWPNTATTQLRDFMDKYNKLVDILLQQQERIEELENKIEQIMPTTS